MGSLTACAIISNFYSKHTKTRSKHPTHTHTDINSFWYWSGCSQYAAALRNTCPRHKHSCLSWQQHPNPTTSLDPNPSSCPSNTLVTFPMSDRTAGNSLWRPTANPGPHTHKLTPLHTYAPASTCSVQCSWSYSDEQPNCLLSQTVLNDKQGKPSPLGAMLLCLAPHSQSARHILTILPTHK